MASPAAEARAKAKDAHPEAVVVERRRNSIKHRLADAPDGRQRFTLDVAIGPLHYGPDNDQEIDTALQPSTAPWDWEMTKAGFEVRALSRLNAGQVIEYRSGPESVRFQPMALQYSNDLGQIQQISMPGNVQAVVDDDALTWADGYGPGRSLSWQAQTARLAKRLTISALSDLPAVQPFILAGGNPVLELNLIFAFSAGVTPYVDGHPWSGAADKDTQGLVEFRDVQGNVLWWFNLPRSWDAEGNVQLGVLRFRKQGNSLYVSHRLPLSFVQGAVYPLTVDVDVDEQVDRTGDDGDHTVDLHGFSTVDHLRIGDAGFFNKGMGTWAHFRDVPIPAGATIDAAYLTYIPWGTDIGNVCRTVVQADSASDAPVVTTHGAYDAITRTTASAAWNPVPSWIENVAIDTPDISTVVQEVIDGGFVSGNDMTYMTHDQAQASNADAFREGYDYTDDSAKAAQLHVEYTPGAAEAGEEFGAVGEAVGAMYVRRPRVVSY